MHTPRKFVRYLGSGSINKLILYFYVYFKVMIEQLNRSVTKGMFAIKNTGKKKEEKSLFRNTPINKYSFPLKVIKTLRDNTGVA